ncbi:MAG: hypothetical protein A3B70_03155 [Deltaproteobacteria bacterium RIFCSPHIGHO2_02_FULL_40_11]|nr:MAG: hypothetical protein A3B70_03155 [Deltaproteobacteria bacterium RIFCSPHIGHO2_02_FULL_40_11]
MNLKAGIRVLCLMGMCVYLCACPFDEQKINGVYFEGSVQPPKELFMLAQVYYQTPPQNFSPAVFSWNLKDLFSKLEIYDPKDFKTPKYKLHFSLPLKDIAMETDGESVHYRGKFFATEDSNYTAFMHVWEHPVEIFENGKTWHFLRRDMEVCLWYKDEIIGWFKGASMNYCE